MIENVLESIQKTENEASEIIQNAQNQANAIILEAENSASQLISGAEKNARAERKNALFAAEMKANQEYEGIIETSSQECQELKAESQKSIEELSEYIFGRLKNGDC